MRTTWSGLSFDDTLIYGDIVPYGAWYDSRALAEREPIGERHV